MVERAPCRDLVDQDAAGELEGYVLVVSRHSYGAWEAVQSPVSCQGVTGSFVYFKSVTLANDLVLRRSGYELEILTVPILVTTANCVVPPAARRISRALILRN